jgi:hypothetical protein
MDELEQNNDSRTAGWRVLGKVKHERQPRINADFHGFKQNLAEDVFLLKVLIRENPR